MKTLLEKYPTLQSSEWGELAAQSTCLTGNYLKSDRARKFMQIQYVHMFIRKFINISKKEKLNKKQPPRLLTSQSTPFTFEQDCNDPKKNVT